jgi:hypothetical protein
MDSLTKALLMGAAGVAKKKTYVDDVFSMLTKVAPGGTNAVFDVGIDFADRGGMFWAKQIPGTRDWRSHDTERGTASELDLNTSDAAATDVTYITSWNNNGYTISSDHSGINKDPYVHIWFNFAKQEKFLDIVTYTGNGTAGREIAHNLDANVGFLMVKRLDTSSEWTCWHRRLNEGTNVGNYAIMLDTYGQGTGASRWNDTAPTSSKFTLGNSTGVNANGGTYVAYLFAHNDGDGEFGEGGDQDIIKCSSYSGNGSSSGPIVNLGWEPQFIIFKCASSNGEDWMVFNSLRGIATDGDEQKLILNSDDAEVASTTFFDVTSTGFKVTSSNNAINKNGEKYIYIAIRRPDGLTAKPAKLGTDVFAMNAPTGSASTPEFISNFPVDYGIYRKPASTQNWYNSARLIEPNELKTDSSDAESAWANGISFNYSNGWGTSGQYTPIGSYQSWMWKRHAGFDVVCYTGTGSNQTIAHSLGVAPELIFIKNRDSNVNNGAYAEWIAWHKDLTSGGYTNIPSTNVFTELSTTEGVGTGNWFNSTAPTSSVVTLGVNGNKWDVRHNQSGDSYLMLLFASVTGICKVGSYDGQDSTLTITTGFAPRFLIIKRTNGGTGSWYVLDTVRGWGSGDDKDIKLNMNNAQQDYDIGAPTSTGFTLTVDSAWNASGSKYIYYSHA